MTELPLPLQPMAYYDQFILWKLDGGNKFPVDYRTGRIHDAHDLNIHMSADDAIASARGTAYNVGFVFTANDPFFFLDIDHCVVDNAWSPTALAVLAALPGAAVEVSQSGTGLHIFGVGSSGAHRCKNIPLGLELYTDNRFVALTGNAHEGGSAGTDCSEALTAVVGQYFPLSESRTSASWTNEADPLWQGYANDEDLLRAACDSLSDRAKFGMAISFNQLWTADVDALASAYPGDTERAYDSSSADASLAQHLAFWTGNNCERIQSLMEQSALKRDKWEREDYMERTILHAVSLCQRFHTAGDTPHVEGAVPLVAKTEKQRKYAESIRYQKLVQCGSDTVTRDALLSITDGRLFLDHKEDTPVDIVAWDTKPSAPAPGGVSEATLRPPGLYYMPAVDQPKHFEGCVYVQAPHKVFTLQHGLLNPDRFNVLYGGWEFEISDGGKSKDKAWIAFTESQLVDYPIAHATCFRPEVPAGSIVHEDGYALVNTYVAIKTPREEGDVSPFLRHIEKMLPVQTDRDIVYAYAAAVAQHKGVKFQWCPLLQGIPGNGKTLLSWCVAFAVGHAHTHLPMPSELSEKFNAWLFEKIFIGIEDVYVAESKREVLEILKPMITNDRLAMRAMNQGQVMCDNRANFIMNSNHKDAIAKTREDRRFAVFYTAQQEHGDLERDGMGGDYFPKLYRWLKEEGGYAKVAQWLYSYEIPDALNPATSCHRAPETSSTQEAITASLGSVEHEILEAVAEGRRGFAGGWVSSKAVELLLQSMRMERAIPRNRRRAMLKSLGYDWHPHLENGRVNNPTQTDQSKTCLFTVEGHISHSVTDAANVAHMYDNAQAAGMQISTPHGATTGGTVG